MRQGRWKSIPVARRYIRAGSRWHDHAGAGSDSNNRSPDFRAMKMAANDNRHGHSTDHG